jgi:RHS repeat-associated protein
MAEAYTCFSPCTTKLTDVGFSYTVRGQVSDVYQSTPHSGVYYHVNETYWANGVMNQLSGLSGLPTITYGVDGEGRIYSAGASSGQNPLSSTTYSVASLPTAVDLGSSDSDSFSYDPNTNRMTEYSFNVNNQSVVGNLTWNALGTLASLAVTDPFDSSDAQSCSYTHDDVSRIASANCGSIWSQTFSYDAFGNINKSGSMSFGATYSATTNRMTQIGSSTPTYDSNGNVTNDFLNTYAWDANGRPVTADSVGLTYDALGRMVEQNRSGTYTEIVYAPGGAKLALMSASTLQKGLVPLTSGSMAVYNSSGLAYYRHSDWIGSSRFASTPTRTMYFDGAYAPFGEPYAQTGTSDLSFTGENQDMASNLYDFAAREYGIQGRWPSPDPSGIASASNRNPQTWNRYAYVSNSPLVVTDPNGLSGVICGWCHTPGDDLLGEMGGYISSLMGGDIESFADSITTVTMGDDGSGTSQNNQIPSNPCPNGLQDCYIEVPAANGSSVPVGLANGATIQTCTNPDGTCDTVSYWNSSTQQWQSDDPTVVTDQQWIDTLGNDASADQFLIPPVGGAVAAACAPMFAECVALATAGALTGESLVPPGDNQNAGVPQTGHNPDDGPNGGSSNPDPPPVSDGPNAGGRVP